jgi:hypothetical protein
MNIYSKVKAAGLAGILAGILISILRSQGIDLGPDVENAILILITVLTGYLKKEVVAFL